MKKLFKRIFSIPKNIILFIKKQFNKTAISSLFQPDPEKSDVTDTLQKAVDNPADFWNDFVFHMNDLRKHIFRATIALFLGAAISFLYIDIILNWLTLPVGGIGGLQANEVTESVGVVMRVTFLTGFLVSLPYIVFEGFLFIAPSLQKKSRWLALSSIPLIFILFSVGVAFTYYVMLPPALSFLANFMDIQTLWKPASYFRFVTGVMFWLGLAFELPLATFMLAKIGLLKPQVLQSNWRIAFIFLAIVAAIITPTVDPINMLIVLIPLWTLFGFSILMAHLGYSKPKTE
jgi:sec-independent protein translocase protein TatC